jgi:hypothetical protein
MSKSTATARTDADSGEFVSRAQFRMIVRGLETAWVRAVSGAEPGSAQIAISLDQLTLHGPLIAVRERLAAMVELVDDVAATPERWPDLQMQRVGDRSWRRTKPHPFVRRPAGAIDKTK